MNKKEWEKNSKKVEKYHGQSVMYVVLTMSNLIDFTVSANSHLGHGQCLESV